MSAAADVRGSQGARPARPAGMARASSGMFWLVRFYIFTVVVPIGFDLGPLALTTLRMTLLIATVPLFFGLVSGRYGRTILTDWLFLAHILWGLLALAVNNPDRAIEQTGSVGIEFIGGYLLGRCLIRSREDFVALCRLVIWTVVLLILPLALFENLTGRAIGLELIRNLPVLDAPAKVRPDPRMGFFRAQTLFAHAIHSGLYCSIAMSLCWVSLRSTLSVSQRLSLTPWLFLATLTSLSSGALLALVLQLGLITWQSALKTVRARWWILVGLFVLGYVVVDLLSSRTPLEVFMSYATFSSHNAYWRSIIFDWGLDNVTGNAERGIPPAPFFGIGLNDWIRPPYMYSGSMDNFWLVIAVRYGLPGFLLLAAGYLLGLGRVVRRNFESDPVLNNLRTGWVFTFMGLTFTLCTVHVWGNIYSFVFFLFGAGMWFITAEPAGDDDAAAAADPDPEPRQMRYSRF